MITFMKSSSNQMLHIKLILLSTLVVSVAVILKFSLPSLSEFFIHQVPQIWAFFLSWLRPPYLYLLINFIIISIVASSKYQPNNSVEEHKTETGNDSVLRTGPEIEYRYDENGVKASEVKSEVVNDEHGQIDGGEEFVISRSAWTPLRRNDSKEGSLLSENEKPPASARFGHRKAVKASPEGKTLGVTKPKRHDTLESTWRTITEGRPIPLARHLKKSETWESHGRVINPGESSSAAHQNLMKKSDTFSVSSGSTNSSSGSTKLRREPSLSQDELNRRVEAFIKKFNEEMRLQRQESLNQYKEMIGRGAG
ncbi:protein of unknown function DUF4408 [Dillenia turbinata]|uniref:DUF4408 domain-containing protein n=1 Tax=Dillenia turbinata TaxID=194707 RepID=A0AAN8ZM70_9MAGN